MKAKIKMIQQSMLSATEEMKPNFEQKKEQNKKTRKKESTKSKRRN